jgi:hypothetical protein
MAIFFANLVPWIAFLWALSMALFYRNIFRDVFSRKEEALDRRMTPLWVILGLTVAFIVFPVQTIIDLCLKERA